MIIQKDENFRLLNMYSQFDLYLHTFDKTLFKFVQKSQNYIEPSLNLRSIIVSWIQLFLFIFLFQICIKF